jgi:hypothetical protein
VEAEEGLLHEVLGRRPVAGHHKGQPDEAESVRLVKRRDLLAPFVGGPARLRHWVHTPTDEKTRERLPVSRADLTGLIIAYAGTFLTARRLPRPRVTLGRPWPA